MKRYFEKAVSLALCFTIFCSTILLTQSQFKASAADTTAYKLGDIIEYGSYPQSKVTDAYLIAALNDIDAKWVSYGYYSGTGNLYDGQMQSSNYMRYKDVAYMGNKYRAVIFDKYRPSLTGNKSSAEYTKQDDNGYTTGNVYWFKFEPIKWKILDPNTGLVLCDTVIDAQAFNNYCWRGIGSKSTEEQCYGNAQHSVYASNYAESSIRRWLNNDFYNTAFSDGQKSNILTTALDNSANKTEFDSISTSDKVFLLSYSDSLNTKYGFNSSEYVTDVARQKKSTDYAKSQGNFVSTSNGYIGNTGWWLRSAYYSPYARVVTSNGDESFSDSITDTAGIAPAIKLQKIKSDSNIGDNENISYSVGDIIEYGNYPQSEVKDEELIAILNAMGGEWTSYNYYSGSGSKNDGQMIPSDYMRYKDVAYKGNKYRGVVFDQYRPYSTGYASSPYSYQDDNGFETGNVYWFKYEPVKWRVLDPSTGFVMCDIAIDSQPYNNYLLWYDANGNGEQDLNEFFGDKERTYYADNYKESSIRKWLNNDFYDTVFTSEQKANISLTTLDNSSTYSSVYDAPSTKDKVFLLSFNDSLNTSYGFDSNKNNYDTARQLKSTDYAKCQGCYSGKISGREDEYADNVAWWLRTPNSSSNSRGVRADGQNIYGYTVEVTYFGVVPAIRLKEMKSDTSFDFFATSNGDGTHSEYDENGNIISTDTCEYYTETTEADCLNIGEVVYICIKCGYSYSETLSAKGHTEKSLNNGYKPTCVKSGMESDIICSVCNVTIYSGKTIPATGHTAGTPVVENESSATCGEKGSYDLVTYCSDCGAIMYTEKVDTEKLPHTNSIPVKENEKAATCTEAGSYDEVVYCSVCEAEISRTEKTIVAKGHIEVSANNAVDVTCSKEGKESDTICSVCGVTLTTGKSIAKLEHTYTVTKTTPTCTERGSNKYTCSSCGYSYEDNIVSATGHTPGKSVQENYVASTCTKSGSRDLVVYCTVCNTEIRRDHETLPANGHADKNNDGLCDDCNIELNHKDKDGDGLCDNCNEELDHKDKNGDGLCDNCNEELEHKDKNGDGLCDNCNEELDHKDKNGDGLCDHCKKEVDHKDKNNDGKCDHCGKVTDKSLVEKKVLDSVKIYTPDSATVEWKSHVTYKVAAKGVPQGYSMMVYLGKNKWEVKPDKNGNCEFTGDYGLGKTTARVTVRIVKDGEPKSNTSGPLEKDFVMTVKSAFGDKLSATFKYVINFFRRPYVLLTY